MIKSYLTIAWRNLLKGKLFTVINVFGLAVGMTCCMLLLLYILSEVSFDKHQEHAKELYLVRSENVRFSGERMDNPRAPAPYAHALKQEFPEVVQVTCAWMNFLESKTLLKIQDSGKTVKAIFETRGCHVDSTFFDMFSYHFVEGDPKTALNDPHSVVLSEDVSNKLFGAGSALNKTINIGGTDGNAENFKVTGVYRDESPRSHLDARYFLPMMSGWVGNYMREGNHDFSNNNMFYTYIRVKPGTDYRKFNKKLPPFVNKYGSR
jgi:putative ABC transport system permease protein